MPDKCTTTSSQQWVAAVRCDTSEESRIATSAGQNSKAAISNAYKSALGDGGYQKDDCKLRTIAAANDDQSKFADSKKN